MIRDNLAERLLRGPAIGRRLSFGSDSDTGARFTALMYSVAGTLNLNRIDVLRWLEGWLSACADHGGQPPEDERFRNPYAWPALPELAENSDTIVAGEVLALCWRMVAILGFGPELSSCTGCGRMIDKQEMGRFNLAEGGLIGPECRAPAGSRRIGPVARGQLRSLLQGDNPSGLLKPRAHLSLLDDFTTFHMLGGRRLDSFRFLDPSDDSEREDTSGN